MSGLDRAFVSAGAVAGLAGVALAAAAAHGAGGAGLETPAQFCLVHAPALVALGAAIRTGLVLRWLGRAAGLVLVLGIVLFCGDLTLRALTGLAPLRLAAPIGGTLLMAGWALLAIAAVVPDRRPPP